MLTLVTILAFNTAVVARFRALLAEMSGLITIAAGDIIHVARLGAFF